jgi:DNA helicase-2/ATP-dependent DNA helicase PcrA
MEFLDGLNQNQRESVINMDGPMMVIAGAGAGKTRVLTYKIAYLMSKNTDPFNILALTFTNKAAREMKDRIAKLVGDREAKNVTMGTFHAVFSRILRHHANVIGYPTNFTIYDTQDTKSLLKTIIRELGLDDKIYKPSLVYGRISSAKNNLISAAQYEMNAEVVSEDRMSGKPQLFQIYKQYESRCFKAGAMDFDDLLFKTNLLFRDFPEILNQYQHKFKYILVDEYQDTNYSQYLIVKKLAAMHENLCVVGDDAQSIYAFRGANIENILNFKRDYPDFKLFKLEQNYRSTKTIVDAANSVISNNKNQIKKDVWTSNDQGNKIKVYRSLTDNEEGKVIANAIFDSKQAKGLDYSNFAILYRTNAQSRPFEEALRKLNLPYKIYGGTSFYQRKEVKDLIAYFRLIANPNDEEALKRVINYPKRGIGNSSIDEITIIANRNGVGLWEVISDFSTYPVSINAGAQAKIKGFVSMLQSFSIRLDETSSYDLAQEIAKSSGILKELYDDKSPEGVSRYENIQGLLSGIKEFSMSAEEDTINTLSDFLMDVALLTDADKEKEEDKDKITMMTIHAAKGLEFPYVYIVGMEENLFPSQMVLNSREELEEERRLFYVALTRAEQSCTLSYAVNRFKWGNLQRSEPSRFIEEIDEIYLSFEASASEIGGGRSLNARAFNKGLSSSQSSIPSKPNLRPIGSSKPKSNNSDLSSSLKVGHNVIHEQFGKGKVMQISGNAPDKKALIFFPSSGQKTLLLRFAKLEIID